MKIIQILAVSLLALALSGCSSLVKELGGKSASYSMTFFAGKIVPGLDPSTGSPVFEIVLGEGIADVNTCLPNMEVESFTYQTSIWNSQNITEGHYVHIIGHQVVASTEKAVECKVAYDQVTGKISILGGLSLPNGKTVTTIGNVPLGTKLKTVTIGSDGKVIMTDTTQTTDISTSTATDSASTNEKQ